MRIAGYLRVSTDEQATGLRAQEALIHQEAERRGWAIVEVHRDVGVSGRRLDGRLGLSEALRTIEGGEADALVVAKLDRLSRSLIASRG